MSNFEYRIWWLMASLATTDDSLPRLSIAWQLEPAVFMAGQSGVHS